ncbi:MAG: DNA gyrase modulator, partial [Salinisphaeraceae bacterium]|nr:DNA gyrase modulator [Salinisphaeraceae bacterium]
MSQPAKQSAAQVLDQQLPSVESLRPALEVALEAAKAGGASQCAAGLAVSTALSVNVRQGEVETVEFQNDRDLGVTVYLGQRKGSASPADLSEAA